MISKKNVAEAKETHNRMAKALEGCTDKANDIHAFAALGLFIKSGEHLAYLKKKLKTSPKGDQVLIQSWIMELEDIRKTATEFFIQEEQQ